MALLHRIRDLVFVFAALAFVVLAFVLHAAPNRLAPPAEPFATASPQAASLIPPAPPPPSPAAEDCRSQSVFQAAARDNAASIMVLNIAPFGAAETGWAAYQPMVAREVATTCQADSPGFAAALGRWQAAHQLAGAGAMNAATLQTMAQIWLLRRPFVLASKTVCPPAPDAATLAQAASAEAFAGKTIIANTLALAAFRRMAAAMQADAGAPSLKIASAYRDPIEEAARCADGGCGTPAKARCSAHRTGLAFDFYLGAAPGLDPFSTDPVNRLYISQTQDYRWLVRNADRFGFVNYPYEPWHWEWTGASS